MGDKFCPVIVSTFSSAGPVWRNIKMEKAGYCLDQLFVSWIKFSEDGLHVLFNEYTHNGMKRRERM